MPDPSQFGPRRLLVPLVGLLIGVLPILGYALQFGAKQRVGVFSFSVAVALAAGSFGCFLGFLFAIPRFDVTDRDIRDVGKYGRAGWLHNTNLSQISDWLTKILVGVGLTQFRSIGDAIGNLLIQLRPGLGGLPSSAAFGGLLIGYFATMGVLAGYVLTALYLRRALAEQDEDPIRQIVEERQQPKLRQAD
jgi:hypothetical protein